MLWELPYTLLLAVLLLLLLLLALRLCAPLYLFLQCPPHHCHQTQQQQHMSSSWLTQHC
jgi:hypothetical protein